MLGWILAVLFVIFCLCSQLDCNMRIDQADHSLLWVGIQLGNCNWYLARNPDP